MNSEFLEKKPPLFCMFCYTLQFRYVAMSDQTSLLVKALREKRCDWAFLPELFYPAGLAMALPEDSPFTDIFSKA